MGVLLSRRVGERGTMKRHPTMGYMCNVILGAMKRRGGEQIAYAQGSAQALRELRSRNQHNSKASLLFYFGTEVRV